MASLISSLYYSCLRPRLVEMHHEMLAPQFSWLTSEPLCRMILFAMAGLGYAYYCLDMKDLVNQYAMLKPVIGSEGQILAYAIKVSWIFGVFAHLAEAIYTAFVCKQTLKMRNKATLSWFIMVSLVGFPMTMKVLEFISVHNSSSLKKNK